MHEYSFLVCPRLRQQNLYARSIFNGGTTCFVRSFFKDFWFLKRSTVKIVHRIDSYGGMSSNVFAVKQKWLPPNDQYLAKTVLLTLVIHGSPARSSMMHRAAVNNTFFVLRKSNSSINALVQHWNIPTWSRQVALALVTWLNLFNRQERAALMAAALNPQQGCNVGGASGSMYSDHYKQVKAQKLPSIQTCMFAD